MAELTGTEPLPRPAEVERRRLDTRFKLLNVPLLSFLDKPCWQKTEYEVPDNWWHGKEHVNVPVHKDATKGILEKMGP